MLQDREPLGPLEDPNFLAIWRILKSLAAQSDETKPEPQPPSNQK